MSDEGWVAAINGRSVGEIQLADDRLLFRKSGDTTPQSIPFSKMTYVRSFDWTGGKVTGFYVVAVSFRNQKYGVLQIGLEDRGKVYFLVHPKNRYPLVRRFTAAGVKHRFGGRLGLPRSEQP